MHDTTSTSTDLRGWAQSGKQYESLPGQQELFSEWEKDPATHNCSFSTPRCELFETGKDLPGAAERDQAIFWDVCS